VVVVAVIALPAPFSLLVARADSVLESRGPRSVVVGIVSQLSLSFADWCHLFAEEMAMKCLHVGLILVSCEIIHTLGG